MSQQVKYQYIHHPFDPISFSFILATILLFTGLATLLHPSFFIIPGIFTITYVVVVLRIYFCKGIALYNDNIAITRRHKPPMLLPLSRIKKVEYKDGLDRRTECILIKTKSDTLDHKIIVDKNKCDIKLIAQYFEKHNINFSDISR